MYLLQTCYTLFTMLLPHNHQQSRFSSAASLDAVVELDAGAWQSCGASSSKFIGISWSTAVLALSLAVAASKARDVLAAWACSSDMVRPSAAAEAAAEAFPQRSVKPLAADSLAVP